MNTMENENKLIASLVLVFALFVLRWAVVSFLKKKAGDDKQQLQRWINTTNNVSQLLMVLALVVVWVSELRYAALSVAAFMVAIVIAIREFIQNLLGTLYLATTKTFVIGDWISINGQTGEVIRSDWMRTVMLEVDVVEKTYHYTGRTLIIPNNQFITQTTHNLNFMRHYVNHSFTIIRDADTVDLFLAKAFMLQQAAEQCQSFRDVARRYNSLIESRLGNTIEGPGASVRVTTSNLGKNVMTISVFCPTDKALDIEQQLTEAFMQFWYAENDRVKRLQRVSGVDAGS